MEKLLEIKNLTISYNKKIVVKNFNMHMDKGEIISIVGESGSGKTTILRSILRLLSNSANVASGSILFKGKDILRLDKKVLRNIRGKEIAMIFQDVGLFMNPAKTIKSQFIEYICVHNKISKKEAYNRAKIYLTKVQLLDSERILSSYPFELSGGMKQRVGIAMAMSQKPEILIADEPTSVLDATVQAQVVKELKKIRDEYGTAILLVTHNMGVASHISDRIIVMKDGNVVEFGTRNEIIFNPQNLYTKQLLDSVINLI